MNKIALALLLFVVLIFSACSSRGPGAYNPRVYTTPKSYSPNKDDYSPTINNKIKTHPTMKSYVVRGVRYYPTIVSVGDSFKGRASWYGSDFHGKHTSSGEIYNMYDMTAAHKTLPMNTIVKVTNLDNGLTTVVRINDRGPFIETRIIDLSKSAASKIDMIGTGTARVNIEVLGFETGAKKNIPTTKELKKSPAVAEISDFALQIASFTKIEGAIKTQELYDNIDGYKTVIKDMENEDGRIFKVWLKGFKSEQEARDYKDQGNFENAFIVRED